MKVSLGLSGYDADGAGKVGTYACGIGDREDGGGRGGTGKDGGQSSVGLNGGASLCVAGLLYVAG